MEKYIFTGDLKKIYNNLKMEQNFAVDWEFNENINF